jgi:hypothetical protein
MHLARVLCLACVLLVSGCANLGAPAPDASSASRQPQKGTDVVPLTATRPSASAGPASAVDTAPRVAEPVRGSAAQSTPPSAAQPDVSVAKAPAKSPAIPPPRAQASKKESTAPDISKSKVPPATPKVPPAAPSVAKAPVKPSGTAAPAAKPNPPLDMASLEKRLKETQAIGVLTKLTLKNQVDDLLDQFRSYYKGTLKTDLATLRQSYDLLVLKVLSLLQDRDQPLATALAGSREEIWGILSDPAKFATI